MTRTFLSVVVLALFTRAALAQRTTEPTDKGGAVIPALPADSDGPGESNSEKAKALVRALLKREGGQVLSTGPESAAKQFHFLYGQSIYNPDSGKELELMVTVVREGDRSAVVVRAGTEPDSPVFCYATEGLVVAVDATRPGSLAVMGAGYGPAFEVAADDEGLTFQTGFVKDRAADPDRVRFDPGSFLKQMLDRAEEADYGEEKRLVTLRVKGKMVAVRLVADADERRLGLDTFFVSLRPGAVGRERQRAFVGVGEKPWPDENYFITRDQVEGLGLPIVEPRDEDFDAIGVSPLVVPPDDFAKDERVRRASAKLESLFVPIEHPPEAETPPSTGIGDLPPFKL